MEGDGTDAVGVEETTKIFARTFAPTIEWHPEVGGMGHPQQARGVYLVHLGGVDRRIAR